MKITARIHNARLATFDGRDLYLACIHVDGRFKADLGGEITAEATTVKEARFEAARLLRARGEDPGARGAITLNDRPNAPCRDEVW